MGKSELTAEDVCDDSPRKTRQNGEQADLIGDSPAASLQYSENEARDIFYRDILDAGNTWQVRKSRYGGVPFW